MRRPDRSRAEAAAAVGADASEHAVYAISAEGAFEGADAGLGAVERQVAVAAFAVGAEFEHAAKLASLLRGGQTHQHNATDNQ